MPKLVSNRPSPPVIHTKKYEKFSGVDFSTDPATIQDNRSPLAVNVISDSGGYPEKRVGWRVLEMFEGEINGIYHLDGKVIIHAGDKMYYSTSEKDFMPFIKENTDTEEPMLFNNAKSFGIVFAGKLWILTGKEFLCYDGEKLSHVRDVATVPQVLSQADEHLRNGISYQSFNLLTPKRKVGVKITTPVSTITIHQNVKTATVKVYSATTGEIIPWSTISRADDYSYSEVNFKYTINPSGNGEDVIVEYEPYETPKAEDNRKIIEHCTFAAIYENRLFIAGNPEYPNTDFYCELNDPTYFSDVGYSGIGTASECAKSEEVETRNKNYIGTGGTRIMGYSYVGKNLAIHKDGNDTGASLYLRSSSLTDDGMIFPITEGIVGESIVSPRATASFIDDPIFLTKSGVYAVARTDVNSERCLQSRSTRVDAKLTLEENLENAEMCVYDGYLMLFINGNVYVADSRQKSYVRNVSNAYEYEWYFWDNIPARVVKSFNDTVYFGTEDGRLCRFNNDVIDGRGGYAMNAYNDDGAPITALWATKMDDMGDFNILKHLKRRGSGAYVKSFGTTNIKVDVRTDYDFGSQVSYARRGLFNFQTLDFANFTFNTLPFAFVPFNRKVKDFRMAQVIIKNDEINQALGVYGVELRFTKGYFAK